MLKRIWYTDGMCRSAACAVGLLGVLLLSVGCGRREAQDADAGKASPPAVEIPADAPVLAEVYPALSGGALRLARLTGLPDGVLLQAEGIVITQGDLEDELDSMPRSMHEQMRQNAFFMLEQKATGELLLARARATLDAGDVSDTLLIQRYFDKLVGELSVNDAEVEAFYEANREMIGGAAFEQVAPMIRQHLMQERQQEVVEQHIRGIGRELPIAMSATWVEAQSILALDNPLDRARASGTPTFASFGADSCMPCQMMKPFREAIAEKYGDRLNVVYVHVNKDQVLASRYGVRGIPHIIFFDDAGNEAFARAGFMTQEQLEEWIAKIGVEL